MNDALAGVVSGFVQTLLGHPLDTAKVLLQSRQARAHNRALWTPRALYRGVAYPFLCSGVFSGVTFGVDDHVAKRLGGTGGHFASGFAAGAVGAVLTAPVDLRKIRAQRGLPPPPRASLSFRGFVPTLWRESTACALYFGSYHALQERRGSNPLLHGGVAGVVSWLCTFPVDTVKTRIQAGEVRSMAAGFRMGGLWCGIVPCLVRSFAVNACGFYVYDWFKRQTKTDVVFAHLIQNRS